MYKVKISNIDEFKFYYGPEAIDSYLGKSISNKSAKFYTILQDNLYVLDFAIYLLPDNDIELAVNYNLSINNTILKEDVLKCVIKYFNNKKYNNIYITLVEHIKGIETIDFNKKLKSLKNNKFKVLSELDDDNTHAIKLIYKIKESN